MQAKKESTARMQIIFSVMLFTVSIITEFYMIAKYNGDLKYLIVAGIGIISLMFLYLILSGVFRLRDMKEEQIKENYINIMKVQKASYLLLKNYSGKMNEKPVVNNQVSAASNEEIINAQNKFAKLIINRNHENTEALMNSNDQVMELLEQYTNQITQSNKENLEAHVKELEDNFRDFVGKQEQLLEENKEMEKRITDLIMQTQQLLSKQPINLTTKLEIPEGAFDLSGLLANANIQKSETKPLENAMDESEDSGININIEETTASGVEEIKDIQEISASGVKDIEEVTSNKVEEIKDIQEISSGGIKDIEETTSGGIEDIGDISASGIEDIEEINNIEDIENLEGLEEIGEPEEMEMLDESAIDWGDEHTKSIVDYSDDFKLEDEEEDMDDFLEKISSNLFSEENADEPEIIDEVFEEDSNGANDEPDIEPIDMENIGEPDIEPIEIDDLDSLEVDNIIDPIDISEDDEKSVMEGIEEITDDDSESYLDKILDEELGEDLGEDLSEEKPPMPDLTDPNRTLTPDEIAALIANL